MLFSVALAAICKEPAPYLYNGRCYHTCPLEAPEHMPSDAQATCVVKCETNGKTVRDGAYYCLREGEECPQVRDERGVCRSRCDASVPLFRDGKQCLSACPSQRPFQVFKESGYECAEACVSGFVRFDGTAFVCGECNTSVEFTMPFMDGVRECRFACRAGLVAMAASHECVSGCGGRMYNNLCFEKCPEGTLRRGDACYDACPPSLYRQGQECVDECPEATIPTARMTCEPPRFSDRCDVPALVIGLSSACAVAGLCVAILLLRRKQRDSRMSEPILAHQ